LQSHFHVELQDLANLPSEEEPSMKEKY